MIDHTGIEVTDYVKSKAFYDAAFGAMGGGLLHTVPEQFTGGAKVVGYGRERPVFWLHEGSNPGPGRQGQWRAGTAAALPRTLLGGVRD